MNTIDKSDKQKPGNDHDEENDFIELTDKVSHLSGDNDEIIELTHVVDALDDANGIGKNTDNVISDQVEKTMERVIEKMFSEKIEVIIVRVIEKVVTREIDRLRRTLLDNVSDDNFD